MIGKSVSHYQIIEKLGAGGMGVVWKARDSRLNRVVALKMLPPDYRDHPERRQRFLHEAQTASALSHPHIVTVHDIVEHEGAEFIVMEHVPGKALDALIPRKGMRLTEALRIAVQIADALSAAHRAGIVHRDLKPGNVMVSDSGSVKVLDFGLAKTAERAAESEDAATRTVAPKTMDGLAVGTIGYMSPEQAEAKPVDARSDIFSFGALLYEMLTGERAFRGDTSLSTVAAILHKEPAPLGSDIPAEVHRVIARCLRKDPRRRFQHMDDLMVALEELREESESGALAAAPVAVRPSRKWIVVAVAAAVAVLAGVWWIVRGRSPAAPLAATEVPLTSDPGVQSSPGFSPDANQVAYMWNGPKQDNFDIYVKLIGSPTPLRLTTDPAPDISPAFSPDGRAIAFLRSAKDESLLMTVPPIGGPERVVAQLRPGAAALSYFPDGKSVAVDGLRAVSMETGEIRPLITPPAKPPDFRPAVAPNGRAVAFARGGNTGSDVYVLALDASGNPAGTPQRLTSTNHVVAGIAWTADSAALVVGSGAPVSPPDLWRIGVSPPAPPEILPFGRRGGSAVAIARAGNRLAYSREVAMANNIWRLPLAAPGASGSAPAKFLPSTRYDFNPAYSPDGKRVVFHSSRTGKEGLWIGDAGGSAAAELFVPEKGHAGSPDWSPDGQTIAFDWNESGRFQIYTIRAAGGKPNRLTDPGTMPSWSADGKWIYFTSGRSGRGEIWKVPAAGGQAAQVTRNGGLLPRESADGRFVCYGKNGAGIWRMPVAGGDEIQVVPSLAGRNYTLDSRGIYFVSPHGDGKFSLAWLPFDGGKPKTVLPLPHAPLMGMALSPDGLSLLYTQFEPATEELVLVENFK